MNKNLLIKQNNELFDKIKILKKQNVNLLSQVADLKTEIEEYKNKTFALEEEINSLKINSFEEISSLRQESEFEDTNEVFSEKENIELPEEFNFASDIIGNIVIKAANYINVITEQNKDNKKELINLILGRTEIAKAEILNVISSELSEEAKKEFLNSQYDEAIQYFKSVSEQ